MLLFCRWHCYCYYYLGWFVCACFIALEKEWIIKLCVCLLAYESAKEKKWTIKEEWIEWKKNENAHTRFCCIRTVRLWRVVQNDAFVMCLLLHSYTSAGSYNLFTAFGQRRKIVIRTHRRMQVCCVLKTNVCSLQWLDFRCFLPYSPCANGSFLAMLLLLHAVLRISNSMYINRRQIFDFIPSPSPEKNLSNEFL